MKINKGIIKNINRKILAGGLALTLISSVGCTIKTDMKYRTDENGYIVGIDGSISKGFLSNCYFCKVKNNITEVEYYTILKKQPVFTDRATFHKKYDLFTNQELTNENFEITDECSVTNYLNAINKIKDEYTEEELKEFVDEYASTKEKNKELVKD